MTKKRRPAEGAPVIDVGAPPTRATVVPPPPEPPPEPAPAGVMLGGVPVALPPELARPIAELHDQALAIVTTGTTLARSVSTFLRALEDARAGLAPKARRRRARPRRR